MLRVSAAGRERVLVKEPLHTGLMQPDSLISLCWNLWLLPAEFASPRTHLGNFFSDFLGVVYLAGEQQPPLRTQTRWCWLPLPLRTPDTLLSFGPPQVLARDCPPSAPPASVVSPVPSPFTPRLPSHWPPPSACPPFVLALFTPHTHTSSGRSPLPGRRTTGRRTSFQPQNTQLISD